MPLLATSCDYCFREFGYPEGAKAICLHCGLENIRPAEETKVVETAMQAPAPERAVRRRPVSRPRAARRLRTAV